MLINLLRVWWGLVYKKESICCRSFTQISKETSVIIIMFSTEPPELGFDNLSWVYNFALWSISEWGIKRTCSSGSCYMENFFQNCSRFHNQQRSLKKIRKLSLHHSLWGSTLNSGWQVPPHPLPQKLHHCTQRNRTEPKEQTLQPHTSVQHFGPMLFFSNLALSNTWI